MGDNQPLTGVTEENRGVLVRRGLAILGLALSCASAAAARDLAVVSNKANGVQTLTLAELAKLCKGQMNRWPNGQWAVFVMVEPGSAQMKMVLQKILELQADQVPTLISTANHGRSEHPAIVLVHSDQEAVAKVQSTPGAVGIVDVYSITGGVAVVKLAGKNPFEPGYPLHGN